MNKCFNQELITLLFDNQSSAKGAAEIGETILVAQSLRLTDVAVDTEGKSSVGYKRIQHFLKVNDPPVHCGGCYKKRLSM